MNNFKKIISVVLAALLSVFSLLLSGCEGSLISSKAPDMNKQFEMIAKITCESGNFTVRFSRSGIGKWRAYVLEPYEVEGVSFVYDSVNSASMGELQAEALTADFLFSPPAIFIRSAEKVILDANAAVRYNDSGFTVTSGDVILSFAQNGSAPDKIEIANEKITAEISEFQITGEIFGDNEDVVLIN